jgi:hypothetical protein
MCDESYDQVAKMAHSVRGPSPAWTHLRGESRVTLSAGILVLLGWLMGLTPPGRLALDVHRQVVHIIE